MAVPLFLNPGILGSERDPGSVVAEAKPRGQAGVIEGAGEGIASLLKWAQPS
jgi:hypothetical protein